MALADEGLHDRDPVIGKTATNELIAGLQRLIADRESQNIKLDYAVMIERSLYAEGESEVLFTNSCEFFMDEHGHQWVKFIAKNGYAAGKEHMIRTDCVGFTVIRDDR